ncbi:MAG: leucyl aminopeptidase [Quisquiliibacterium sp.]
MQFSIKTSAAQALRSHCVIVPVLGGRKLTEEGKELDDVLHGEITAALARNDLAAKAGSTQMVYSPAARTARVMLVSMGKDAKISERAFREAARGAIRQLGTLSATDAVSLLHAVDVDGRDLDWRLAEQVTIARDLVYRFEVMKSRKDDQPVRPDALALLVSGAQASNAKRAIAQAQAIANGVDLARDLGNLPGNVCTPTYLADSARKLGRKFKMKVQVLERRQMEALKMGALLAVAKGSAEPPKFIVMHYQGAGVRKAPVVLVGKGITFDTGGISLKPGPDMDQMKFDMCGAASVLGTMHTIAELKLPINVVGLVPTCENMPSGTATRPGDIVTSMSGQTIEILNTDAEGRLILCDALTYAERFKPAAVVDIATLTGACVIALGNHHSGLFAKSDELADELLTAGKRMGDTCWRMPLDEEYQEQLKSPYADMANIGGRAAGSVTAACFLARYAGKFDWAHLDIAGTAWKTNGQKGSSGRPVPLLSGFLIGRAGA